MTIRTLLVTAGVAAAFRLADRIAAQQPLTASTVSVGDVHACALTTDGRAYCWGLNTGGALGTAGEPGCMASDRACTRPVLVSTDLRFASISAGFEHTCALTADSIAWCWGANGLGELGLEPATGVRCGDYGVPCVRVPTRVPSDIKFGRIVAGQAQTCALDANGRAYCWGYQNLGTDQRDSSRALCAIGAPIQYLPCNHRPTLVDSTATFLALDLQQGDVCGLKSDGNALCWGLSYRGNVRWLGAGQGGTRYVDISVGMNSRVCALLNTGGVFCWGEWPPLVPGFLTSRDMIADTGFVAVSVGTWHACGLRGDGRAYCWGENSEGQLGVGGGALNLLFPQGPTGSPVRVAGDFTFRMLICRGRQTCVVTKAGGLMCWGRNNAGQLGDGSLKDRNRPTPVAAPAAQEN